MLSPIALSRDSINLSILLRTSAGSVVPSIKLKPTFTLFSHTQFFFVNPSTHEVQYVIEPEQVLQGVTQAKHFPWETEEGKVKPSTQLLQML